MKKSAFILFIIVSYTSIIYCQSDWIQQNSGTLSNLSDVYFVNADTGWVVGDVGTILNTKNGGENWEVQNSLSTSTLIGVHFSNSTLGWTVGMNGTYRYTSRR